MTGELYRFTGGAMGIGRVLWCEFDPVFGVGLIIGLGAFGRPRYSRASGDAPTAFGLALL